MEYEFYAVRVFVTDWERALRFYTETLEIPTLIRDDGVGWAQLAVGDGHLALERIAPDDPEANDLVGRFVGVSLRVPDIGTRYEVLTRRGVRFVAPPEGQSWGGVLAHFHDPDGNVISLVEAASSDLGQKSVPGPEAPDLR